MKGNMFTNMKVADRGGCQRRRKGDNRRTMRVTGEQIRWFRLRRSGLVEPFGTPEETAGALAGVQAQILSASMLALWNRSAAGAETDTAVAARLFEARTLLRLWGQRHTLHLYDTRGLAGFPRGVRRPADVVGTGRRARPRRGDRGVSRGDRARSGLVAGTRDAQPEGTPGGGHPDAGRAVFSVGRGVRGVGADRRGACHARWDGGEARYAHRSHWLPELTWTPPTAAEANAELARRYFRGYGPATAADFAYWRGGAAGPAKVAVETLGGELMEVDSEGGRSLMCQEDAERLFETPPERETWPVRMLGRFDPLLLAHRVKDWVVPAKYYDRVWRPAGHIEATVLEHGQAVAIWRYDRIGAGQLAIRVFLFRSPLPRHVGKEVRRQAKEVARFFGLKLAEVRIERSATAPGK